MNYTEILINSLWCVAMYIGRTFIKHIYELTPGWKTLKVNIEQDNLRITKLNMYINPVYVKASAMDLHKCIV